MSNLDTRYRSPRVQPHAGPTPGEHEMSDEQIDALRASVPDDPVPLPEGCLACPSCGIAVRADPPRAVFTDAERHALGWGRDHREWFARCADCQQVHAEAAAYVAAHPGLVARYGTVVSQHAETVLLGLAVLGRPAPEDLAFLLPRLLAPSSAVRFRSPVALTRNLCSPRPFAHVTTRQRAALLRAYTDVLGDRWALHEPPVALACPSGGCVLCGLASVSRSAIEVRRWGGVEAATNRVWTRVNSSLAGHLCPWCAEAVSIEGALGASAMHRALLSHLPSRKAQALRHLLDDDIPPLLPAWGSTPAPRVPNTVRFAHLRRPVLDRL